MGDSRAAVALYDQAISIWENLVVRQGRREFRDSLAMAYMNKAIAIGQMGNSQSAVKLFKQAIASYELLVLQEGRDDLSDELARAYLNGATAVAQTGDLRTALTLCDQAIAIWERLVRQGRRELLGSLAKVKGLRAIVLINLGKRAQGVNELREAVKMLQAEVARGRADLQGLLRELSNNLQQFS